MLLRVQNLMRANGRFVAVALGDSNAPELIPVSDEEARKIRTEFERASPQIEAAAVGGFPVPEAIPVEVEDRQ